ncbi:hypothetical protein HYH03_002957 [Edaphochlamys debaryana]|uniref:PLA2c domain-containing protein n=1 Tax=Edaphochlamys debaryana TaxID=47281 RepID=A0A835YAK7_9CHLO|nr:hypothetical protein HYH03_002957 [Edaphochlamys debaryana]|eukprot:KAG2499382.1 hypothetical protein HYH03_002957 [Edaphochlamys debaryana]
MLNVYSPSDPARVFVWSGSDQPGFVFPELDPEGPWGIPALQARPNIGLALSGGGYRAATLALGWVRALHVLGVLPHLRYIASNSGGSWFNGALSYGGYPVGAFLGPYAPPAALNRDALASSSLLPAGSWGDTVAAKSIIPDAVKDIIGDLFAPSHESVGGWTHSITENFLRPYGLGLQNSSITALGTRGEVATRLAAAYPGVPLYAAMATPDRAYPIVLGSIMDVNTDRVFYPFEITPLYAGAPARFPGLDPPIGAGFLEPLGFNSPAPSNPPRGAPAVGLQGAVNVTPERLVPLATYLGISSSFVAQGLRPASSSGFTLTGTERLQYWNTLDYKGARLSFADGGGADNLAVAPLLRRRVKHVVVAVAACTSADVAAADWAVAQYDVAGLFGAVPLNATQYEGFKEGITGVQPDVWNRALQVFPREGFDELYAALQERLREGRPAVHRASYTVLDNPGQAIQGGWSVDVLWVINMKVDAWEEQLPDDTRDFLKHVRNEAGSDMRHYPYINLYNTYYSRELVTLMSQQASWTTLQAAPELRDMLAQAAADTPKSPSPSGTAAAGDAAGAARVAPAEGGDGSAAAPAATATAAPAEATSASGSGPAGGMEPSEDGSTATAMSMPPPSAPEATSSAGAAKVDAPDSSTVEGAGAGAGAGAATTAGGANGAGVGAVAALLTATTPAIEPDVAAVTEAAAQRPLPTAAGLEAFLRQPTALQLAGALPPPPRDTQEGTGTAEGVDASAAGLPAAARKPEVSYIIMNLVDKGARTERNGAGGSGSTPVHIVGPDVTDALAATAAAATGQTGAAGARGGAVRGRAGAWGRGLVAAVMAHCLRRLALGLNA